jgi:allantoinase
MELCIQNAVVVTCGFARTSDLYVSGGKIAAIACPGCGVGTADTVFDAKGKLLIPGVVDPHVHGGYGEPERESYACVGRAAAAGGVTTLMEQPLSYPPTATAEAFSDKRKRGEREFCVDFSLWGGLIPGHLDDMKAIYELGGGAFKSFMCRCSNYPSTNDGLLLEGLKKLREFGGLSAVHAENDTMIQELADRFSAEGKQDVQAFLESHPPYSELEAIRRYILIAEQVPGSRTHVVHCSIPEGIEAVDEAKRKGLDMTVETCPQYLALTEDDLYRLGGVAKCDPPVRSKSSVERMWELVKSGKVDMIASDHSPHPFAKKVVPMDEFSRAAEGVTGVQTMLPVLLTEGVYKRGLPMIDLVRLLSENSARRYGLWGRKGALLPGFDADFSILDPDAEWTCRSEDLYYLNRHTPYEGRTFHGKLESTWLRGVKICESGKVLAQPGFGAFYPMKP